MYNRIEGKFYFQSGSERKFVDHFSKESIIIGKIIFKKLKI